MKKQLLAVALLGAMVTNGALAIIYDRKVTNQTDYVIFVAWKNAKYIMGKKVTEGSKSRYERIMPGDDATFGALDRGYGMKGAWGNTIQVEFGEKIGKSGISAYTSKVRSWTKSLENAKEAFVREEGGKPQIVTAGELAGPETAE